jgi:hypothetical protein
MTDSGHRARPSVADGCIERRARRESGRVRGSELVDRWLDLQDEDRDWVEDRPESELYRVADLVVAGAPDAEVAEAVRHARLAGWGWAPLAVLLDVDVEEARRRFGVDGAGDGPLGSALRSIRGLRRWHPPRPRAGSD